MTTPYDGKIGLWHVAGSWVGEATIEELGRTIRKWAPNADAVFVKTSQGDNWQGAKDPKTAMAINGPDDLKKWVDVLQDFDLEVHAWCVAQADNVDREADLIIQACQVPGVRSMILDVEPFDGFLKGGREEILDLCRKVRDGIGADYHLGMSVDPRSHWYDDIFPDAWRPFVGSIHPQVYWHFMGREPADVINETYVVWGPYGLPIYPVLQGWDVDDADMREAFDIVKGVRGATGVSYFRLGTLGPMQFPAVNDETIDSSLGPDNMIRFYDWEKIVGPGDQGFLSGTHTGQNIDDLIDDFVDVRGKPVAYKKTEDETDTIWTMYVPQVPSEGTYEISVYIPGEHATTTEAQYHIHGIKGRENVELLVRLNQSRYKNMWVPLVVYDFTTGNVGARVNVTDLTGESDKEIAFGAVRWRRVTEQRPPDSGDDGGEEEEEPPVDISTQGFDAPVGTVEERLSSKVWPGTWFDATGYATFYTVVGPSYHTGVDLNNNRPKWDSDKESPVYAAAHGVVIHSGVLGGSWGHVIVIRHDPLPDGTVTWTRYAHVHQNRVREGQRVERGEQLAVIGSSNGKLAYHLHYDIMKTNILERFPGHWPGMNLDLVFKHYHDPKAFTINNRPPRR